MVGNRYPADPTVHEFGAVIAFDDDVLSHRFRIRPALSSADHVVSGKPCCVTVSCVRLDDASEVAVGLKVGRNIGRAEWFARVFRAGGEVDPLILRATFSRLGVSSWRKQDTPNMYKDS
jgi:hypothetical protein